MNAIAERAGDEAQRYASLLCFLGAAPVRLRLKLVKFITISYLSLNPRLLSLFCTLYLLFPSLFGRCKI